MKIKNVGETSDGACPCGSWLKHWEKFSGQTTVYCLVISCLSKDLVGAHVQKSGSSDTKRYIYPLCKSHSESSKDLDVSDNYRLVAANRKETCEP